MVSWTLVGLNGGLSPRVRGNLDVVGLKHQVGGSIPAGAGEPLTIFVILVSGVLLLRCSCF